MPIISAEPRPFWSSNDPLVRDIKDGVLKLAANPDEAIVSRPIPARTSSKLLPRRQQQPTLVDEFIHSFKELESYK